MQPQLPLLVYDDQCPLCVRFKETLGRLAGFESLNFWPLSNAHIFEIYPQLSPDACLEELHYLDGNGAIFAGTKAIEQLMRQNSMVEKFAWLVESGMGQKALDFFYSKSKELRQSLIKECQGCKKKRHPTHSP
jgi:predicted DCC family thiol-disulfide oxidoreductase YuxK